MGEKLATIRRIDRLEPIPGTNQFLKAIVGEFQVIVSKDSEFKKNDKAIHVSVDTWIPHELINEFAPFLSNGEKPKEYNGIKGELVREIKLHGVVSQGLLIPYEKCLRPVKIPYGYRVDLPQRDEDVSGILGIQKWVNPNNTSAQSTKE